MSMCTPPVRPRLGVRRRLPAPTRHAALPGLAFAVAMALGACTGGGDRESQAMAPAPASTQPLAVDTPPPDYPLQYACAGAGGEVTLVVRIAADGAPAEVRVEYASRHPGLDAAALAAVRTWRFKPATRRGKPVATTIRVPVKFTPPPIKPDQCGAFEEAQRRAK